MWEERKLSDKGEQDYYEHQVFKQLREGKLILKITLEHKIQTLKYVQTKQSQQHNDQTYIAMHLKQLEWILHAWAIQCKRENDKKGAD